jgi:ribosomal protein L27
LFADRSGDSFIIEAGNVIVRKKGNYQVMTNFHQSRAKPEEVTCPRYKLVTGTLADQKALSVELVRSLLKATSVKSTQYSTIFNLGEGEVHVHRQGDFERVVRINLKEELGKGERAVKIGSLFEK